jgi:hypothetical protein
MKKSMQLQVTTVAVLVIIAVLDAFSLFIPLAALGALALVLFKPRWLLTYMQNLYGAADRPDRG